MFNCIKRIGVTNTINICLHQKSSLFTGVLWLTSCFSFGKDVLVYKLKCMYKSATYQINMVLVIYYEKKE